MQGTMKLNNYERELKYLINGDLSFDEILRFLDEHDYSVIETKFKKKHETYYDDKDCTYIKRGDVIRSSTHYNTDGTYSHFMYKKNVSEPSKPYVSKYEYGAGEYLSVYDFLTGLDVCPMLEIVPVLYADMIRETCVVQKADYKLLISYDDVKYYKNDVFAREKMLEIEDWTTPYTLLASTSKYDLHLNNINNDILGENGLPVCLTKDSKPYRGIQLLLRMQNGL